MARYLLIFITSFILISCKKKSKESNLVNKYVIDEIKFSDTTCQNYSEIDFLVISKYFKLDLKANKKELSLTKETRDIYYDDTTVLNQDYQFFDMSLISESLELSIFQLFQENHVTNVFKKGKTIFKQKTIINSTTKMEIEDFYPDFGNYFGLVLSNNRMLIASLNRNTVGRMNYVVLYSLISLDENTVTHLLIDTYNYHTPASLLERDIHKMSSKAQ